MTVTSIGALAPEIKRALDQNQKTAPAASTPTPNTAGTATLPTDSLAPSIAALTQGALIDLSPVILQVEAQNRDAAASVLSDADLQLLIQATVSPQEAVQNQAKQSIAAQTNKLPNSLLALLGE